MAPRGFNNVWDVLELLRSPPGESTGTTLYAAESSLDGSGYLLGPARTSPCPAESCSCVWLTLLSLATAQLWSFLTFHVFVPPLPSKSQNFRERPKIASGGPSITPKDAQRSGSSECGLLVQFRVLWTPFMTNT